MHPLLRPTLLVVALGLDESLCVDADTIIVYDRDAQAWPRSASEEWRKVPRGGGAKKAVLPFHWLLMVHGVPY